MRVKVYSMQLALLWNPDIVGYLPNFKRSCEWFFRRVCNHNRQLSANSFPAQRDANLIHDQL